MLRRTVHWHRHHHPMAQQPVVARYPQPRVSSSWRLFHRCALPKHRPSASPSPSGIPHVEPPGPSPCGEPWTRIRANHLRYSPACERMSAEMKTRLKGHMILTPRAVEEPALQRRSKDVRVPPQRWVVLQGRTGTSVQRGPRQQATRHRDTGPRRSSSSVPWAASAQTRASRRYLASPPEWACRDNCTASQAG